jgi:hypothetical protein
LGSTSTQEGEALELIDADFFGGHIEDYDSQNGGFQFLLYRGGADQSGLFCSCDLGLCWYVGGEAEKQRE